jgi:hypothetical protein
VPTLNSFADHILDWQTLLLNYELNAGILAPAEPQRDALEAILSQAQEIKARQLQHIGEKQLATQQVENITAVGREAARRLRRAIEANVGTDSELLVQFGIAPIRRRSRKKKAPVTPQPPAGGNPEPEPEPEPESPPVEIAKAESEIG